MTASAIPDAAPRREVALPFDAPCVVLFGMSGSGKSSLLGALARASEVQESVLGVRLQDPTRGLQELRDRVYEGGPPGRRGEVIPYPVRVESFLTQPADGTRPFDLVLIDCDGRAAGELLGKSGALSRLLPDGLVRHILGADAVLLTIDAAAPAERMDAHLNECVRFLKRFRGERGERSDVSALPVFLVLTKCDLLARSGDTQAVWTERVEARKEEAAARFEEIIAEQRRDTFGTLMFTTAAAATHHPELANAPAGRDEPFGVAELFSGAVAAARTFHTRRAKSDVRVNRVLTGAAGVGLVLLVFAAALVGGKTLWRPPPLADAVRLCRDTEGPPPAGHLDDPVGHRIDALVAIAKDPEFGRLKATDRAYVSDRLDELRQYQDYLTRLRQARPPTEARGRGELKRIEQQLRDELAIPTGFGESWGQAPAGRLRARRLSAAVALETAVAQVVGAYDAQRRTFEKLYVLTDFGGGQTPVAWSAWAEAVAQMIAASDSFPIRAGERIPGQADDATLTYAVPLAFTEAEQARAHWAAARARLERQRDVVMALALVPSEGPTLRPPAGVRPEQIPGWLAEVRQRFPRLGEWTPDDVSDAAAGFVRTAARSLYDGFLPAGRAEIGEAFFRGGDEPESPARWRTAVTDAAALAALQAWNEATRAMLRLAGDAKADPLAALTAFLRADTLPIEITAVRLTLPDELGPGRLTPQDDWRLTVQDAQARLTRRALTLRGEPVHDAKRRATVYTFSADAPAPVAYRAGDTLWAELALRDAAGKDWQLSWWGNGVRSRLYQFDRLTRAPRLHRLDERPESGAVVGGVVLEFIPPAGVPRVPDLFPEPK